MRKFQTALVCAGLLLGACGDDDVAGDDDDTQIDASTPDAAENPVDGGTDAAPPKTPVDVTADITADTTWTADKIYTLKQHVFVQNAKLTIEAGTLVLGDSGSSLVITSTAKLEAIGTAQAPIVFTSSKPEGMRKPGDWGGVVMLGLAPINVTGGTNAIEGFPNSGMKTQYGGNVAAHDCGKLKYARIEFAGFQLAPDNELNGLTVGGCGSATELDFIQVHKGADDGIEFFGGTTNIKHAVITQPDDDGLDWDFGWIGKVQFLILQQNAVVGDAGIEADNNGNNNDALPRSKPTIYNATFVGSDAGVGMAGKKQSGMVLRRGTAGQLFNIVVAHFADFPIDIDDVKTADQWTAGELAIKNALVFDNGNQATWDDDEGAGKPTIAEGTLIKAEATVKEMDPKITSALNLTAPSFKPAADSPALVEANAATPPSDGFFDATAKFVGAVGATDWTAGWTAYPAN